MAKKFQVSTIFKGIDKMSAPISRIQNRIASMTRSADKRMRNLRRTTDGLVKGFKKVGRTIAIVGAIATAGLTQAATAGINFEQTIVNAAAKFPGEIRRGTDAFKELEAAAQKTGATTEFTATQSAQALNFLAMAGFNAERSIAALPGVVNLATAAQVDLATATDIATDTLGAFGLESKDAVQQAKNLARVNDVLAKTATSSNTSMVQLFQAMKKGGPIATAAGSDIETVAALIGTMANAGIKAELAGTAVANAFLNLSSPVGKAQQVMRRLGIEIKNTATGELKDMPDIIDELNIATAKLTKTQRLAALEAIFGREGLAGTAKVVSQGGDALREFRERLRLANGSANEMAKTMRDTTRGSLNALRSSIEGVSIALFNTNRGPMKEAIDLSTQWVRANGDLIAQNIGGFFLDIAENFGIYLERAKQIGTVIGLLFGLNLALKAVAATTAIVNGVMALNPFVLVGVAIAGMVIFVDDLIAGFERMPEIVQRAAAGFGFLLKAIKFIKDNFNVVTDAARAVGGFLGLTDDDEVRPDAFTGASAPGVVSPQERIARSVSETNTTSTNEIIIKDETGRAEVRNVKGPQRLTIPMTGGFF